MSTLAERATYHLSQIQSKPVEWLWQGRLARGAVTILEADPGMGKGLIAMDIAARITSGEPMPFDTSSKIPYPKHIPDCLNRQPRVLICSTEDSRVLTQKARAEAAGARVDQILCMDPDIPAVYAGGMVAVRDVLNTIQTVIYQIPMALIIIDPLFGFLQALSAAPEKDARYALAALASIAERYNCAILAIRHLNKSTGKDAIYRGTGTIAFSAAARIVLALQSASNSNSNSTSSSALEHLNTRTPEHPRLLTCIKNNLAEIPESLAYKIVSAPNGSARIQWLGPVQTEHRSWEPSARETAEAFLLTTLSQGPVAEAQIRRIAKERGISHRTLRRAKKTLDIRSVRPPECKSWHWTLP